MTLKTIKWREGLELPHDPNNIEEYTLSLVAWLGTDVITGLPNVITGTPTVVADAGLTATYIEGTGLNFVGFRISGGTIGVTYKVVIHVASGTRESDHTILFVVRNR